MRRLVCLSHSTRRASNNHAFPRSACLQRNYRFDDSSRARPKTTLTSVWAKTWVQSKQPNIVFSSLGGLVDPEAFDVFFFIDMFVRIYDSEFMALGSFA